MEKRLFYDEIYKNGETFGEFIRQVRLDKGMTCAEFAEKIHVTEKTVQLFESDKKVPNRDILKFMSGNLGISFEKLRMKAGYMTVSDYYSRSEKNYYLPNGKPIDIDEMLEKIYYEAPDLLLRLDEIVLGRAKD